MSVIEMLSLPAFLRALVTLLVIFAALAYVATGSAWTTFISTTICVVAVQFVYFVAVLFLIWRGSRVTDDARDVVR
jgi:hypothetical protein